MPEHLHHYEDGVCTGPHATPEPCGEEQVFNFTPSKNKPDTDKAYQIWQTYEESTYNGYYDASMVYEDSPVFRHKEDAEEEAKRLNDKETDFQTERKTFEHRQIMALYNARVVEWDALREAGLRTGEHKFVEPKPLEVKPCTDFYVEEVELR